MKKTIKIGQDDLVTDSLDEINERNIEREKNINFKEDMLDLAYRLADVVEEFDAEVDENIDTILADKNMDRIYSDMISWALKYKGMYNKLRS